MAPFAVQTAALLALADPATGGSAAASAAATKGLGQWFGKVFSALSAAPRSNPPSLVTLEGLLLCFIAASEREGLFPVLLIDEANAALPSGQPEAQARTR